MSDKKKSIWQLLHNFSNNTGGGDPPNSSKSSNDGLTKIHWLLILASVGIGILIVSQFFSMDEEVMPLTDPLEQQTVETSILPSKEPKTMAEYEKQYEDDLKVMLGEIVGVSDVIVMVNLESSEEIVLAENIRDTSQLTDEKDQQGGTRQIKDTTRDAQVVIANNGSEDSPFILKTIKPKVRGVFVIAKGADNPHVKTMVTDAIQRVLDVPYNSISVLPKK